jgi:hypothetical protein
LWDLDAKRADLILDAAGVDPVVRPETLGPMEFAKLLGALSGDRGDSR